MAQVKRVRRDVSGIILLDKPRGFTSNAALQKVRWLLNAEKAGHTGSLDPLATGVLPLCFGEATKFSQYLLDADKGYETVAQLGVTTNKDGTLSIDDAKLSSALETHYDEVQAFFVGDDGLIPRLKSVTEPYTAPGGLLAGRTESLQKTMTQLSEQQQALDRRIDSLTTSLYTKYNNMDILVAQLNASSASLLSTLEALNNSNKK